MEPGEVIEMRSASPELKGREGLECQVAGFVLPQTPPVLAIGEGITPLRPRGAAFMDGGERPHRWEHLEPQMAKKEHGALVSRVKIQEGFSAQRGLELGPSNNREAWRSLSQRWGCTGWEGN